MTPPDVIDKYSPFHWIHLAPQAQAAIRYLNVTASGRQWITSHYASAFGAEREIQPLALQMSVGA